MIAPPRHTISQAFSSSEMQKETSKKYQAFLRFKNDLLANRDSISKNDCSNISPFCSTKDLFDLNKDSKHISFSREYSSACVEKLASVKDSLNQSSEKNQPIQSEKQINKIEEPSKISSNKVNDIPSVQFNTISNIELLNESIKNITIEPSLPLTTKLTAEEKRKQMTIEVDVNVITITPSRISSECKQKDHCIDTNDSSNSEANRDSLNRQDIEVQPSFLGDNEIEFSRANKTQITSFIKLKWKSTSPLELTHINPKDIDVLLPIGSGSFGSVFLW